jgi:AraC-like DNA-binding protein
MPHGRVFTFDDPHRYQAAIRAGDYEILAKSKNGFDVELTRIDLNRLWMQASHSGTSYVMNSANDPARVPILFMANADQAPLHHNGLEVTPQDIVVYRRGATNHVWTQGNNGLATMSLAPEDLAAAGRTIAGRELTAPLQTRIVRPSPVLMARLRALHQATCQLAKNSPGLLAHPAMARALEHELVRAMVACLAGSAPIESKRGIQHAKVIARFEDFLAAKRYEPVYLAEICAAIGVSERTLRSCCQEYLGMGPIHYLWLRRMHLARRALVGADAALETVTDIATEHGFWELGRFSVEYRTLFGESPSATLKRPPDAAYGAIAH